MALRHRSLFLYGFEVTPLNSALDFRAVSGGPVLLATLRLGFYSLTDLMEEIARAMTVADPNNEYAVTADRTIAGGLQNRVTIETDGIYLDLLFLTGPRAAYAIWSQIGFAPLDFTGATSYTGNTSAGTVLMPELTAYRYIAPTRDRKVFGAVNVSASGVKETVTFQVQQFMQAQFKYEPESKVDTEWVPFVDWVIRQRGFEFTPEYGMPGVFYNVTLERTGADGLGLAWRWTEQLPSFPGFYDSGNLTFRVKV